MRLLCISLAVFIALTCCEHCTDINNEKDSKGWKHIDKINGQSVKIPDKHFNSTYEIGICKNLLEDNESEYAGALEFTQDNRTIIVGRYNASELMYGSHWILLKYLDGEPYEEMCSDSNRHAAIMFVCNHDAENLDKSKIIDENLGRDRNCYHLFEIEHCIACISDGCNAFFYRFSPGTIILIGLFSTAGAYLLFGWIITRFVCKRKGWRQIPNAEFWQEIGHLQADGCNMACRCGKRPSDDYHLIAGENTMNNPNNLLSDDEVMLPP